ncbi:chemotaxis protein CheB [Actinocrispum sp. NPDC049592]|uniref:chemotaxis protein CheB n=1 Tax=Actinocrispum sp. NPDC049592 TaxID=3154835 RepID=UPI00341C52B2
MTPQHRDLVVIGASAGGVEALKALVAGIPPDLPAAVVVVLHLPAGGTSALAQILRRFGPLPAVTAASGMPIARGKVYVAPPDHHLLVLEDQLVLSHGPTENGHRPAINALFRSAAVAFGPRVTGMLLSGVLDDGVAGLVAIRDRGGRTIVQDPRDALYPGMPTSALSHLTPDHVLTTSQMGDVLLKLAREEVDAGESPPAPAGMSLENGIALDEHHRAADYQAEGMGEHSGLTCPDCQGSLSELAAGNGWFRCRVGHAWSEEALLSAQGDVFERALWTALRSLDEKASLSLKMRDAAIERGNFRTAERYALTAEEATEAADVLRGRLTAVTTRPVADEA